MEILGFWKKLFTSCVSVVAYKTLSDKLENLSNELNQKVKKLTTELTEKTEAVTDLRDKLNNLDQKCSDLTIVNGNLKKELDGFNCVGPYDTTLEDKITSLTDELKTERETHNLTLKLLGDTQTELSQLKQTTKEEFAVDVLVTDCGDIKIEDKVAENVELKKEVAEALPEPTVGEEPLPKEEDTVKAEEVVTEKVDADSAKAIVDNSDNIQKFVNTLTKEEKKELKKDILKGHQNDKRISGTLKGWEKKYPLLETHVYYMFKTALTRRRGKNVLNVWYSKFDDMVK